MRPFDQTRKQAIYIFGDFAKKYTDDIFEWFGAETKNDQFGKINWLHDYALNFWFEDALFMQKVLETVCVDVPELNDDISQLILKSGKTDEEGLKKIQELIRELRNARWKVAEKWDRCFLIRPSIVTDVKTKTDDQFRNHGNFPGDNRKKIKKQKEEEAKEAAKMDED